MGKTCCCAFHSRRCLRLLGLRFLLHVGPASPGPPEATPCCCCCQQQEVGVKQQHGGKQQQEEEGKHRIEDKVICSPEKRKKHCNVSSLDADQQQKPQNQQQHQSPTDRAWGVSSSVSARPPSREARAYSRANGPLHQQQQRQQQQPDASGCSCGCRGHRHGAPRVALASYKAPGYTPVYSDNASRYLVSVNAGDPQLYVGGGSINLAFLRAINEGASRASLQQRGPLGGLDPSWGQRMRDVHASALAAARRAPTGTAALHCADAPGGPSGGPVPPQFPFWGIFSIVPTREEAAEAKIKETDCFVSLDMFHREMRPLSEKNIGMVYVVGPKGWAYSKDNFYRALFLLARNLLRLVAVYNTREAQGPPEKPPVEQLRMPLVSGGAFRGDKDPLLVASAIVKGFLAAAKEHHAATRAAAAGGPPDRPPTPNFARPQALQGDQKPVGPLQAPTKAEEQPQRAPTGKPAVQHNKAANAKQPFKSRGDEEPPVTVKEGEPPRKSQEETSAHPEVELPAGRAPAQDEATTAADSCDSCRNSNCNSKNCSGTSGRYTCCCCCCRCAGNGDILPVIEFAKTEGNVFYRALLREWHSVYRDTAQEAWREAAQCTYTAREHVECHLSSPCAESHNKGSATPSGGCNRMVNIWGSSLLGASIRKVSKTLNPYLSFFPYASCRRCDLLSLDNDAYPGVYPPRDFSGL